jgi:hypothetical protein
MKTITALASCGLAAGMFVSSSTAFSACGHDVHGAPTIEVTQLGENTSVMHFFSPATIIMDDPRDPRHRAFGECRGQALTINGVSNWTGACVWKREDGDSYAALWSASPNDKGVEKRETLHGRATLAEGTGKLAYLNGRTAKWSGLANGGSYWCDD